MVSLFPKISRREWLGAGLVGLLAAVIGSWPWLLSVWQSHPGMVSLGTNIPDVLDSQVYYAFIQSSASHGAYTNLFTGETQPAALWNPLWWLLGLIVRFTGASVVSVFWTAKAILGLGLVLIVYRLAAVFFQAVRWRFVALGLAVFGTGLGWAALVFLQSQPGLVWLYQRADLLPVLPTDVTYSAGYVWMSILHSPLFVVAELLMLSIWAAVIKAQISQPKFIHIAGGLTLLLGLIHPYDVVLVFGVLLAALIVGIVGETLQQAQAKILLQSIGWLILWSLPAILYYALLIFFVPSISEWNTSNLLQTTNFRNVLAGYGLLGLFSFFGIRVWWKKNPAGMYLIGWLVIAIALLYLPGLRWQAKMILGLSLPVGFLAAAGVEHLWRSGPVKKILIIAGLSLTMLTPIIFLTRYTASIKHEPKYHTAPTEVIDGLRWLKNNTTADSVILGDLWTGNLAPHYAERATYLGHHHQTAKYEQKLPLVREWFFGTAESTIAKEEFLRQAHITYVFWGPYERAQGPFNPASLPNALNSVYTNELVSIYRVVP